MTKKGGDNVTDRMPKCLPGFENITRYWDEKHSIYAAKILPGEFYVTTHGELIATVLGSCVTACIRDPAIGVGGINHFMLPYFNNTHNHGWEHTPVSLETRYGNIAMEKLINAILKAGGNRKNLEIKLFGGGRVLDMRTDIGEKNIEFVKQYLIKENLSVVAEDVGGRHPRKLQYFPYTGRVRVKKLNNLHNNTLIERENNYIEKLSHVSLKGKVELFE
jgi:chemotaxis protein CheD